MPTEQTVSHNIGRLEAELKIMAIDGKITKADRDKLLVMTEAIFAAYQRQWHQEVR